MEDRKTPRFLPRSPRHRADISISSDGRSMAEIDRRSLVGISPSPHSPAPRPGYNFEGAFWREEWRANAHPTSANSECGQERAAAEGGGGRGWGGGGVGWGGRHKYRLTETKHVISRKLAAERSAGVNSLKSSGRPADFGGAARIANSSGTEREANRKSASGIQARDA
jgi:hypothetical protein